ncbi:hypothetical protein NBRC116589_06710 [Ruegeria sp. HU-ET01832]|uniref:hypothetical protein n=1 Tax=Ruegeria sp. HU-ET01832 TaxID=3135906 RepID=UPI0031077CC8
MKRFEVALEISKQLIAICSAMLVGIAALAGEILNNEADGRVFTALVFLYVFLSLSILAGIFHLGAVTNLAEKAERREHEGKNKDFVSMFDGPEAPTTCMLQQMLFFFSILLLIGILVLDRSLGVPAAVPS